MNLKRRASRPLIMVGLILTILGMIFTLQSKSIVGPSTSFMYSNPGWTVNGSIIIGIGISILVYGCILFWYLLNNQQYLFTQNLANMSAHNPNIECTVKSRMKDEIVPFPQNNLVKIFKSYFCPLASKFLDHELLLTFEIELPISFL